MDYRHICSRQLLFEIAIDRAHKIGNFVFVSRHIFRLALIGNIGRADQRHVVFIRIYEDDAFIRVLHQIGLPAFPKFWNHNVAAFNKADGSR